MKYMKNVYNIDRRITKIPDERKYQKYKTAQISIPMGMFT
jgi:hypothetical protein